jgi:endonuclease-3
MKKATVLTVLETLFFEYPSRKPSLEFSNVLELLIATILSAQCTDERVNKVTATLFNKYPTVTHYANSKLSVLSRDIRSVGLYHSKAQNIINAAYIIEKEFQGRVPDTMDNLVRLPGVARKTANIVLTHGFNKVEGIAVDTHVKRLSERIGFTESDNVVIIEKDLMRLIPEKYWGLINGLFIAHGRTICKAQNPQCFQCVIRLQCKVGKKLKSIRVKTRKN